MKRSSKVKQYQHIGPEVVKITGVRLSQPPDTESCAVRGGIGSEVGNEKDYRNRTTIVKRRQGTLLTARRSRSLLKLSSLERHKCESGETVTKAKPNMNMTANDKGVFNPPGSKRVVSKERDVRNLGGPSASSRSGERRGRVDQRQKATRRVSSVRRRGESDHSIAGRGKMAAAIPTRLKWVTGQRSLHTETYPGEKGPDHLSI